MMFREYLENKLASDPEFCAEYEALAPQYEVIRAVIAARLEKQMTQAELANLANTKQSNISRLESGDYNPTIEFLQKIACALGKDLEIRFR